MKTLTVDQIACLKSIVEYPWEDTPRMMYADMLDECAEGGPLGDGDRAHAELIRLQIGVKNGPPCPTCGKVGLFRGTHQAWCELNGIDAESTDVKPGTHVEHRCPKCDYRAHRERERWLLETSYPVAVTVKGKAIKGIRANPKLKGRELWAPIGLMGSREYRYVRGFVGIVSYTCEGWMRNGAGAVESAPIEMVLLCDRVIREDVPPFGSVGFLWTRANGDGTDPEGFDVPSHIGSVIPESLWDLANALRDKGRAQAVGDAYRWLSWAAIFHARCRAKLVNWVPRPSSAPVFPPAVLGYPDGYTGASINRFAALAQLMASPVDLEAAIPDWHRYKLLQSVDSLSGDGDDAEGSTGEDSYRQMLIMMRNANNAMRTADADAERLPLAGQPGGGE